MTTATAINQQKMATPAASIPPETMERIMDVLPAVRPRTVKN